MPLSNADILGNLSDASGPEIDLFRRRNLTGPDGAAADAFERGAPRPAPFEQGGERTVGLFRKGS